MMEQIKIEIEKLLRKAGVEGDIVLAPPPKAELGDFAFACFDLAKKKGKNPAEAAKEITGNLKLEIRNKGMVSGVTFSGPYVNFWLNGKTVAQKVMSEIAKQKDKYGSHKLGKNKKVMVEFAHPNTHKSFHIGHLRNIITGESIVRLQEAVGYKVIRANYQGDVGMHIAKCLWGLEQKKDEYETVKKLPLNDRIAFLGRVYAEGSQAFEADEAVKQAVAELNAKLYSRDAGIRDIYEVTRGWSLEYFNAIYKRVGTHYNRLYFESEVSTQGVKLVQKFLKKNVLVKSEGAVIFPGSAFGLHDRVFLNSKGFPTYEAKDLALAELQFKEYNPARIIHVVGKEQTEYFKVVFQALEKILPKSAGKEFHLAYGWVQLKEGKMSSRTGKVVLGEWLLDEIGKTIGALMKDNAIKDKPEVIRRVALAAVKYSFLKTGVANDIAFDINESVSTHGDSGPYLLYIVARIKSIIKKSKFSARGGSAFGGQIPSSIDPAEKQLAMKLAAFQEATRAAAETLDPSQVAKYLFDLAQAFNMFYEKCSVLSAEGSAKQFRLQLIAAVLQVMTKGLLLLGIETVEEM